LLSTGKLTGFQILLVEDEPLIGMMIEGRLTELGARVTWVQTDRQAYAALEAEPWAINLLITDINLRVGTTGFDVARFARRLNAQLPVIYLSGEIPEPNGAPDWSVEQAQFLTKPIVERRLIEAILSSAATQADERVTIYPQLPTA
jgi:CheY-like chemotaxis protein